MQPDPTAIPFPSPLDPEVKAALIRLGTAANLTKDAPDDHPVWQDISCIAVAVARLGTENAILKRAANISQGGQPVAIAMVEDNDQLGFMVAQASVTQLQVLLENWPAPKVGVALLPAPEPGYVRVFLGAVNDEGRGSPHLIVIQCRAGVMPPQLAKQVMAYKTL